MIYTKVGGCIGPRGVRGLGIVPVIAGAAAIETAYAWYDPDFFMDIWWEADQEQKVANLNNWWVELERAGRATLREDSREWIKLYGTILAWVKWKKEYNDAILRRWLPWGRDFDDELLVWFERFREQTAAVQRAGGEEAQRRLDRGGVDTRMLEEQEQSLIEEAQEAAELVIQQAGQTVEQASEGAHRAGKGVGSGFLWPAIALGVSAGLIIWLSQGGNKRRRQAA